MTFFVIFPITTDPALFRIPSSGAGSRLPSLVGGGVPADHERCSIGCGGGSRRRTNPFQDRATPVRRYERLVPGRRRMGSAGDRSSQVRTASSEHRPPTFFSCEAPALGLCRLRARTGFQPYSSPWDSSGLPF